MRLVTPAEWVAAPWRNGGGITHEIAREGPPDAFSWRVSVADVAQAGPFSLFPGVDRVISLIEGHGFSLRGPGLWRRATLRRPGDVFAFPGDEPFTCTLLGGPVRDLNVMVDRARWQVACEHVWCDAGPCTVPAAGALLLLFVLDGAADVFDLGVADRHALVVSDEDVHLTSGIAYDLVIAALTPRPVPI